MKAAIYPGSFDPHDIRASGRDQKSVKMFDTLIVSVLDNKAKNAFVFCGRTC